MQSSKRKIPVMIASSQTLRYWYIHVNTDHLIQKYEKLITDFVYCNNDNLIAIAASFGFNYYNDLKRTFKKSKLKP